ncbi:hypothetical protein CO115_02865 [Candidatus Falkowbacteria bacterium CG_4_9_14_3_um_filter_36_9]|uniref:M23ase beta-sheet core domain-containing protein n=1 Tax=Candidatus Falkowbacteria bacterium CG02_land_8_20_14_3_00_36_14 TaxID=1974560 RepID=A0A2M7DPJ1_9BACT|nr:MAG: hypothetical protein COS18_02225 [Candidatus Falkowbacteria bacterium CG02_land_8_20_14_3_00_36_14]PIX12136.1 MAG: hypothetical protein COZ73_00865 [Candidatus Falkowbacteria bacterium CG_4_8_14_3_um_filter_36_11]PJA10189.1 MAG: hypothetical protein COX67_05250 [Candidatus Falkowbacteria bacterium CG_4_10_14_0_2_um_filter_36_22]PJB19362.1 MAG: hypothetical protein CO115_02865 [Candidatus Falkowbacteria bacterium CG_4_9_14_3_um_filter_36_9]
MNKLMIKKIKIILILGIFIIIPLSVFSQTDYSNLDINNDIKILNDQIKEKKNQVEKIQERQKKYNESLKNIISEKSSLQSQLALLDNRLASAEIDVEEIKTEIEITNLEIKKIKTEIKNKNDEITKEKDHLENIIRLIYKQDDTSVLEIILLNNNLSDFLNQTKYLEDINSEIDNSLNTLKDYKKQLEQSLGQLDGKQTEFLNQKIKLEEKIKSLAAEKETKNYILEQTKVSEREYQNLINTAKEEQQAAASEIANLEKSVREKVENLPDNKLEFNDSGLIWPVPKNTITSLFHDPGYPFRYIFEHPAVDIKAAQGTPLKVAASGYVARAKDAGKGYSYIMIVHGNGLSTVYGHVSAIYVKEDDYVVQGQIIGKSGGLPGSPGAGQLTTGPHLHFEVRLNGIPVNPLEYLP